MRTVAVVVLFAVLVVVDDRSCSKRVACEGDDVCDEASSSGERPTDSKRRWPLVPGGECRVSIAIEFSEQFPQEGDADANVA
jgi:hypothetical protein